MGLPRILSTPSNGLFEKNVQVYNIVWNKSVLGERKIFRHGARFWTMIHFVVIECWLVGGLGTGSQPHFSGPQHRNVVVEWNVHSRVMLLGRRQRQWTFYTQMGFCIANWNSVWQAHIKWSGYTTEWSFVGLNNNKAAAAETDNWLSVSVRYELTA